MIVLFTANAILGLLLLLLIHLLGRRRSPSFVIGPPFLTTLLITRHLERRLSLSFDIHLGKRRTV